MKEWERIKQIREDMSEFVLHCTRPRRKSWVPPIEYTAFDVLKQILTDGFLRATFAFYDSKSAREHRPAIRGPYKAVCYTEQPLRFFLQSIRASNQSIIMERYTEFAIAVRKDDLFKYGGRPVLYSNDGILGTQLPPKEVIAWGYPPEAWVYEGGLPLDLQYLWVGYDPTALWRRNYPVDWTHEREWRACPNVAINRSIGLSNDEEIGVPLQLPTRNTDTPRKPRFVILVDTEARKAELSEWIAAAVGEISIRGLYWRRYAGALEEAPILIFETVEASDKSLGRLEDFITLEAED